MIEIGLREAAWLALREAVHETAPARIDTSHAVIDCGEVRISLHDPAMCKTRVRDCLLNAKENGFEVPPVLSKDDAERLAADLWLTAAALDFYPLDAITAAVMAEFNIKE